MTKRSLEKSSTTSKKSSTSKNPSSSIESSTYRTVIKNAMHSVVVASSSNVHVVSHKDGWAVVSEGKSRAHKVYDKKEQAVNRARDVAQKKSGQVVVHGMDGKIQKRVNTVKSKK